MNRFHHMWRTSIIYLLCFFGNCTAWAQTAVFSANASAAKIGLQDQVQVDYTIQDVENLRSISKPDFKDFNVTGGPFRGQSSNISITGNKMVQSVTITVTYLLQPKRIGTLTIPPATAKDADGQTYQSNALSLQVVDGTLAARRQQADPFNDPMADPFAALVRQRQQAMQQRQSQQRPEESPVADMTEVGKNIFIKVTVDKSKAYVGEQITADYKLYTRIPMNVAISKLPSLNGFWIQDFDIPKGNIRPTEEIVDGKKYQVFLLKKSALFPQQTGAQTLDPAEAEGTARILQQVRQRNPFSGDPFFQQAFGSLMMSDPFFNDDFFSSVAYKDVPVKLKSTPLKITVLPLPEKGKPADYGGAVGNFTISSRIDKTKLTTDDALSFAINVSGSGNFKIIEVPRLKLPNGLNTYDPVVTDTISGRTNTISGSKNIVYSITPNTPGDYEIPAVPFTYYNTQSGSYVTLYTHPVKVHVDKGRHYSATASKTTALTDIHPISLAPLGSLEMHKKPMVFTVTYWSLFILPLFAFVGFSVWRRKEETLAKDSVKLRNRRANKIALKRLVTASKLLQQGSRQSFYEEVSKAIWLYLSDKLNIPLSSLSKERAHEALQAGNTPAPLVHRLDRIITECETALYAPSADNRQMQETYSEAVSIISKLEESVLA